MLSLKKAMLPLLLQTVKNAARKTLFDSRSRMSSIRARIHLGQRSRAPLSRKNYQKAAADAYTYTWYGPDNSRKLAGGSSHAEIDVTSYDLRLNISYEVHRWSGHGFSHVARLFYQNPWRDARGLTILWQLLTGLKRNTCEISNECVQICLESRNTDAAASICPCNAEGMLLLRNSFFLPGKYLNRWEV